MKARNLHLDTLKGVLIILVILGHVITRVDGSHFSQRLYDFIYFFHMPLFVYISGFLTKKKPDMASFKKGLMGILIPFFIFQIIHMTIGAFQGKTVDLEYFVIPRWTLWYLLSLAYWKTFIQFCADKVDRHPIAFMGISIALCLLSGLIPAGKVLSIQRTFHFLPFFMFGYYSRQGFIRMPVINRWIALAISVIFASLLFTDIFPSDTRALLFGSKDYDFDRILAKAVIVACSAGMCISMFNLISESSVVARIGQQSQKIYLSHALLIIFAMPLFDRFEMPVDHIVFSIIYTLIILGASLLVCIPFRR